MTINKKNSGFTLIEILLIVAIFAIILSSSGALTTTQIFESDLSAKSLQVSALVETARNNSATGYRGSVWSIKVLDSDALCTDSGDCILLFKGSDFSGRDTGYDRFVQLGQNNSGTYINTDQKNEFYFDYKSGWLSTSTAVRLEQQHIVLSSNFGSQQSVVVYPSGAVSMFTCGEDEVFDVNGNGYLTIKIGTQCWMAENLNVGTMLTSAATTPSDNSIIEKWCYSNSSANCDSDGGLYDWDELMAYNNTEGGQGICPGGWHVPSDAEIDTLEANYSSLDGYNLRIGGPSGFNLQLSGQMNPTTYEKQTTLLTLWSSEEISAGNSTLHYIDDDVDADDITSKTNAQNYGLAARCLKDY